MEGDAYEPPYGQHKLGFRKADSLSDAWRIVKTTKAGGNSYLVTQGLHF